MPDKKPVKEKATRLPSVRALRLRPGDIVVLQTEAILHKETIRDMADEAKKAFGGHKVLILHGGTTLRFVRKEKRECTAT
jgi:hypothetical protein